MVCYIGEGKAMDERLMRYGAVVFDVGNVLLSFDPRKVSLLLPEEHREKLFQAMFGPENRWAKFDLGKESNEEIALKIARAAGVPGGEKLVLHALYHFPEGMDPLPLYAMIPLLRQAGKKVYALTNYAEPSFSYTQERFPHLKALDGLVVSSREKVCKPDERIYRLLQERCALNPQDTLFIDDAAANVEAAARLGFHTWHYAGENRLE